MTTLVAMDNSSLSETVKYDDRAYTNWESRASNIGIVDGEKLSMEDSLYAIMLASANEVFPFPGGPINSSLFLGFIPYDCNKSARFCSLIKSWQADRT